MSSIINNNIDEIEQSTTNMNQSNPTSDNNNSDNNTTLHNNNINDDNTQTLRPHLHSAIDTINHLSDILSNQYRLTQYKFIDATGYDYYNLSYQERIELLQGHSIQQLCKTLLMVNKKYTIHNELTHIQHPQYVLCIIQYISRLHNDKLCKFIYNNISQQASCIRRSKEYNMRLASEQDNNRLTGYVNNALTPFDINDNTLHIIIDHKIIQQCKQYDNNMYLGGGHVDVKLMLNIDEFIDKCNIHVGDITYNEQLNDDNGTDKSNNQQSSV